jgi:hypothetical protein
VCRMREENLRGGERVSMEGIRGKKRGKAKE